MLPGQRDALDRSAFDRKVCDRSHVTALNPHDARLEAMAARAMREMQVYMECAQSLLIDSIAVRLIASSLGLNVGTLKLISGRLRAVHSIAPMCARSHWQELQTSL